MQKPFYGWIIVGVAFLIGITESGAFQSILAIFMKPMAHDFGWSRASIAGAIAFGSLLAGGVSPFIGTVLDRNGPKMVSFWGILFLSLGLIGMTFIDRIWQLYLFLGIGRMIAVGMLSLAISVSVSNWFVRKRGRALGISMLGPRFGTALLPILVQYLILTFGWRIAWSGLGVVVFLLSGIPSIVFLRRRPEDMGLSPDGNPPVPTDSATIDQSKQEDETVAPSLEFDPVWTRAEVIRTKFFWMLTLLHSMVPFVQAGINFNFYPFLTDQGFNEVTAVLVLTVTSISGMLGSVIWGIFSDKVRVQFLLAVNVFTNGIVFLTIYWVVTLRTSGVLGIVSVFFLAALHGAILGGRLPMISLLWADFFGRRSLGQVLGFSSPFRFAANAMGPIFAAFCFDLTGSYGFPFHLYVIFFFLIGVVSFYLKPSMRSSIRPAGI